MIIKWKHNGELINCNSSSCPVYFIKNVKPQDSGSYTCFSVNIHGEAQWNIDVIVNGCFF